MTLICFPAFKEVEVESDGFLKCPFCDEIFADLIDFAAHTNEAHRVDLEGWSQCQGCQNRFPNVKLLNKVTKKGSVYFRLG
jgi:uncharacterized C2H2 Zn-finger protein